MEYILKNNISNDEFYSQAGKDWERRAKKLQARRWKAINRAANHRELRHLNFK